jgi:hypothetical protein
MLVTAPGQTVEIPFVYRDGYDYVDPTTNITIFLKRGYNSAGASILGPYIYNVTQALAASPNTIQTFENGTYVERNLEGSYTLYMKIPLNIFDGEYTVAINAMAGGALDAKEIALQTKGTVDISFDNYSLTEKTVALNNRSKYRQIGQFDTNNILLIGHTDALEPYGIQKVSSIQQGINLLRADFNSPLLRGMFDAYSCGARDIYIMSAGYMSEYVETVSERNAARFKDSFNNTTTFYQLYYDRLAECYNMLREYDFFDIVVPLETSIVDTGTVNFVKQLATYCNAVQANSGEITIGIIGSRTDGINATDTASLLVKDFEVESTVDLNGYIIKDTGKHVILVYGEMIFNHKQIQRSYAASAAAAVAGMISSTQVNIGLSKKRIPAALSIFGVDLSTDEVKQLNAKGINALTRGGRSRKFGGPYDVYLSSDYTQSISESFKDASNVRLAAMVIGEVQAIGKNAIGKFAYSKLSAKVEALLSFLKTNDIIRDYQLESYADKTVKGKIYFNITLKSSRTLRQISFNIATGKGV